MSDNKRIINGLHIRLAFLADRASQEDMCLKGLETCEWYMDNFFDQWDVFEPLVKNTSSKEYKSLAELKELLTAFYDKAFQMSVRGIDKQKRLLKDVEWRNIQRFAADLLKKDLSQILN